MLGACVVGSPWLGMGQQQQQQRAGTSWQFCCAGSTCVGVCSVGRSGARTPSSSHVAHEARATALLNKQAAGQDVLLSKQLPPLHCRGLVVLSGVVWCCPWRCIHPGACFFFSFFFGFLFSFFFGCPAMLGWVCRQDSGKRGKGRACTVQLAPVQLGTVGIKQVGSSIAWASPVVLAPRGTRLFQPAVESCAGVGAPRVSTPPPCVGGST